MNPTEILRIVDAIHRAKNIDPEVVFQAIEAALISAVKKHYGDESNVEMTISREDGTIAGTIVQDSGAAGCLATESEALTSAARYRRDGWWARPLRNLTLLCGFFLGVPPSLLKRLYG